MATLDLTQAMNAFYAVHKRPPHPHEFKELRHLTITVANAIPREDFIRHWEIANGKG